MSELHGDVPPVLVKQSKMFPYSTSKMKAALVVMGLIFCLYLLLVIRNEYNKTKKLDRIAQMLAASERELQYLEKVDRELDAKIRSLRISYQKF